MDIVSFAILTCLSFWLGLTKELRPVALIFFATCFLLFAEKYVVTSLICGEYIFTGGVVAVLFWKGYILKIENRCFN